VKTGKVQGITAARHTSQDFVAFLEGLVKRTAGVFRKNFVRGESALR
jgi:hypothetical protein